jgi:hypothetical protein
LLLYHRIIFILLAPHNSTAFAMESDGRKDGADDGKKKGRGHFGRLSSVFKSKHKTKGKNGNLIVPAKEPPVTPEKRTVEIVTLPNQSTSNAAQDQPPIADRAEIEKSAQEEEPIPLMKHRTLTWLAAHKTENPEPARSVERLPATPNSTKHQKIDPPIKVSHSSRDASTTGLQLLKPIHDLWNEAYEELKGKEKGLIKDYEVIMSKNLIGVVASTNSMFLDSNITRHEQMEALLEDKLAQVKSEVWKLKFGDKVVPVQDLAALVVGIINWAEQYVNAAVSANPYASIAWAGVSLLLPVSVTFSLTNPSRCEVLKGNTTQDLNFVRSKFEAIFQINRDYLIEEELSCFVCWDV